LGIILFELSKEDSGICKSNESKRKSISYF